MAGGLELIQTLKNIARRTVPGGMLKAWSDYKHHKTYGDLDLAHVFSKIYENGHWGGEAFNSGIGSAERHTIDFVRVVNDLIAQHGFTSVVDIGCGDFRVGRQIARPGLRYTGVDVAQVMVDRNRAAYSSDDVDFLCADATQDDLPTADLYLLREVLQHLSNAQISSILAKLRGCRCVVIAEVQPAPGRKTRPNVDKAAGAGTRIAFDSSVRVDLAPFSLGNVTEAARTVHTQWQRAPGETIVTYVVLSPQA